MKGKHLATILATATILLTGCDRSDQSPSSKYELNISEMRSEKSERRFESLRKTTVTFDTTSTLELQSEDGNDKPSAFAYLTVVDEAGIGDDGTLPQLHALIIEHGSGQLKLRVNKDVPDGQAFPIPPKYSVRQGAVVLLEPCGPTDTQAKSALGARDDASTCKLEMRPPSVYEGDGYYGSRLSVSVKVFGAMAKRPLLATLKVKTTSHPDKAKIGKTNYQTALVVNGEGVLESNDYLIQNYKYDDKFDKQPVEEPEPPQFDVSIIGVQPLTRVNVNQE